MSTKKIDSENYPLFKKYKMMGFLFNMSAVNVNKINRGYSFFVDE